MNLVWSAVLALSVAGTAFADDDDEAKTSARTYTQAEIEALQDLANRVLKLEELQQDSELEKLKAAAAKEKQDEAKGLPERMSALEKKMASAGQTYDASKQLLFSTPDGNFTAKVGGRLYTVYRHIFDKRVNQVAAFKDQADSFLIDTARFQLDGSFYKDFYYRIEGEGKSNSPTTADTQGAFRINEMYIGWQGLGDWVAVQMGLFKIPVSQEETCSSRFIDFAERSLVNRITPGRDNALMLKGSLLDKIVEWNLGFCNGHTNRENLKFVADTNDEKDFFVRIFLTPMKNSGIDILKQIRVGADYERGKRDTTVAAPAAVSSGDLALPDVLTFNGVGIVRGLQSRQAYNFSWLFGPASFRAEYDKVVMPLDGAVARSRFNMYAANMQATFLLTGEDKALENRIKPKNNFDPLGGGWGAWELAARWAIIDNGNGRRAGVVAVGNNQRTTEYAFGVNWWMTPNIRMMIDYERLTYDERIPTGRPGALKNYEDEIYIRWQIDF